MPGSSQNCYVPRVKVISLRCSYYHSVYLQVSHLLSESVLNGRVDIPGLLSVNADIYELDKEAFLRLLYSALFILNVPNMPTVASGNCGMVVQS